MDLHHHGDDDVRGLAPGDLDLAVNVRRPGPPDWLKARLTRAMDTLGSYPDQTEARAAVAARHGRPVDEVLLTAGADEAFTLLARVLEPTLAVTVHPSFTGPEAALRDAGHAVTQVVLEAPFRLQPRDIPADADLVVVGNPTNPTGVLHRSLEAHIRPWRTLVVDEAFMDCVPGEEGSLAGRSDIRGLVVVRSITKTWGLAGLRAGYVLADPGTIARLRQAQGHWPVGTLALEALAAVSNPEAVAWAAAEAVEMAADREALVSRLPGARASAGPYLLVEVADAAATRAHLQEQGIWTRRCDTFPGLEGDTWLRIAVPAREHHDRVVDAFAGGRRPPQPVAAQPQGSVTLVGAGPGRADLLTVRGWHELHLADVVVTDRLVDPTLLAGLRPDVRVVDAGKAPGDHHLDQEQIHEALLGWARKGMRVVRLKGGDPFVFGRGGEEAIACAEAGIPCTVVPGLSSSIAGPALAGIPVTHRGLARSFAVVSGHLPPDHPDSSVDWAALAVSVDTLVLLMAVANLPAIAAALELPGDTPLAAVMDAGTAQQSVVRTTLADVGTAVITNPAVIVVGPTVGVL